MDDSTGQALGNVVIICLNCFAFDPQKIRIHMLYLPGDFYVC